MKYLSFFLLGFIILSASKCKEPVEDKPNPTPVPPATIQGIGLQVTADAAIYMLINRSSLYQVDFFDDEDTIQVYSRRRDSLLDIQMYFGEDDTIEMGDIWMNGWDVHEYDNEGWWSRYDFNYEGLPFFPITTDTFTVNITHAGSTDWPSFTLNNLVEFPGNFRIRLDTILDAGQSHTFQLQGNAPNADSFAIVGIDNEIGYKVIKMLPGNIQAFTLSAGEVNELVLEEGGFLFAWAINYHPVTVNNKMYTIVAIREFLYNNVITQ